MRMREARTKFIHQLSCGAALYFSHCQRDTPPVRMMYSRAVSDGAAAACTELQTVASKARAKRTMRITAGKMSKIPPVSAAFCRIPLQETEAGVKAVRPQWVGSEVDWSAEIC